MAAALLAVLGMLGLATENGALAAAGFAFAAQTRMELMTLIPLVWLAPKISRKWKILTGVLVAVEVVHIAWVMSVAPALARSEEVSEVFGLRYLGSNLFEDLRYFFTPFKFPFIASIFAGGAALMRPRLKKGDSRTLLLWIAGPSLVYLLFYGGSFNVNPRYSLQVLAPLVILCASLATQPVAIAALLISAAVSIAQQYEVTPYGAALEADHRLCVDFAAQLRPDDLVVTGQPELFLNQNRSAMSATLASMRKERLKDEIRKRKVWYHSGVRANVLDGEEWTADQWLRSNFDLRLMDSHESGGFKTAFYELSVKHD
jgi:hypothetical protein